MNIELTHTRALVTGASRGIGKAIALALMESGGRVCIACRTGGAEVDSLVATYGGSCVLTADLEDPKQCVSLFERADDKLGGINLLVNNAGIAISSDLDKDDHAWVEDW